MQRRTYRKGVAVGNIVVIVVQQTNKIVLEYGDAIDFFLSGTAMGSIHIWTDEWQDRHLSAWGTYGSWRGKKENYCFC